MLEELEKAEHYIFLEYFILEEGTMWDPILAILRRKAAEGVDVRVIYDDLGSIFKLPDGYDKLLESYGIRACVFNPFIPVINLRMNNRDHRKICVIDGHTGFTGRPSTSPTSISTSRSSTATGRTPRSCSGGGGLEPHRHVSDDVGLYQRGGGRL